MKRVVAFLLAAMLTLSLVGCGTTGNTEKASDGTFDNVKVSAGSGTAGGTQYVYMGGIANVVNNNIDGVELILEGTSGTGENLSLLQSGDLGIACIESSTAYNAYVGESGEKFEDIRSLFVCMPTCYIAVTTDMNANNLEDFTGKIVAVGPANGSTDISSRAVFKVLNLTDRLTLQNAGWGDCFTALTENQVYAVTGQALQPSSAITEAESSGTLNFIKLTSDQLDAILSAYPYYKAFTLSANTYESLTEDYDTFASWQAIYTTTELSDELAYAITKAVFENLDVLTSTVTTASLTKMENIGEQPIPLHPGAYKYYVEQGIEVPAELIPPEA